MKDILDIPNGAEIIVYKEGNFDSAHFLRNYKGKCANMHGHRWTYKVYVSANSLDSCGMVVDFKDLKAAMKDCIEEIFDHKVVNEQVEFNPTAENIAIHIFEVLSVAINNGNRKVVQVDVFESPESCATVKAPSKADEILKQLIEDLDRRTIMAQPVVSNRRKGW
jgi:6-pyruvoyltetrahydropterin/6-carboxytetrahydropterin synthase